MRIPKSFMLFGETITVEYNDEMRDAEDKDGYACYRKNKILLDKRCTVATQEYREHIFCHELVHWLMFRSGEKFEALNGDEDAVDRLALLLHQALTTMEYDS